MLIFWWHTNINDLDLDNILLHKKSYENISINYTAYKTPHSETPCILFLIKQMGILENIALNIKHHLILMKNIR